MERTAECEKCGQEFTTNVKRQKYCQMPCSSKPDPRQTFLNRKPANHNAKFGVRWSNSEEKDMQNLRKKK